MKNKLSPICFFTYNRLFETQQTIIALQKNNLAIHSDLYIFSDGYKNEIGKSKVEMVRKYIRTINGFKSVTIFESPNNKGLAKSIISGVTQIINKFDKVIVLEDDLITSPNFLDFMNQALCFYENNPSIHSISGYTMDLLGLYKYPLDYYLGYRASSWGWGTWKDKWLDVDWKVREYHKFKKSIFLQLKFMRGGSDLPKMLKNQMQGKIDSWAIRWCFNQFQNNQFTIFPAKSKVITIGFGEDATHTKQTKRFETELDNGNQILFNFDHMPEKDIKLLKEFAQKFSIKNRITEKINRFMIKLISKLKYIVRVISKKEILIWPQIKLDTTWFGNKHAGFYVNTKSLNSKSIIYSFGVGEDISFDEKLINEYNCYIYAFDPTPKTKDFILSKNVSTNFIFKEYGLNSHDGEIPFYLPLNPDHVSCSTSKVWGDNNKEIESIIVPMKKFSTIISELGHKKIEILKLDIEGSEYDVLDDILNSNVEINQILIEFHHRFPSISLYKTKEAIKKLNIKGYKIAAISDQYEEYTFIKVEN